LDTAVDESELIESPNEDAGFDAELENMFAQARTNVEPLEEVTEVLAPVIVSGTVVAEEEEALPGVGDEEIDLEHTEEVFKIDEETTSDITAYLGSSTGAGTDAEDTSALAVEFDAGTAQTEEEDETKYQETSKKRISHIDTMHIPSDTDTDIDVTHEFLLPLVQRERKLSVEIVTSPSVAYMLQSGMSIISTEEYTEEQKRSKVSGNFIRAASNGDIGTLKEYFDEPELRKYLAIEGKDEYGTTALIHAAWYNRSK
jgi:hypothetical protein